MKKPYISFYAEEQPLDLYNNLFYDHSTQLNYLDSNKCQLAVNWIPNDKTTETRVVEHSDRDYHHVLGPETTMITKTIENTDEDSHLLYSPMNKKNLVANNKVGPDTTLRTETIEISDPDNIYINY